MQPDLFVSNKQRAEPWRVAAETAKADPHFSESEREKRAAYYAKMAEKIERGEA